MHRQILSQTKIIYPVLTKAEFYPKNQLLKIDLMLYLFECHSNRLAVEIHEVHVEQVLSSL